MNSKKSGDRRLIALCGNTYQDKWLSELDSFFNMLIASGFRLAVESRFAAYLISNSIFKEEMDVALDFPVEAEAVVSFGGDGTFLHAASWVGAAAVPILGVNTGHLGFLASFSLSGKDELIRVLNGRAVLEKRTLLKVSGGSFPEEEWPYALNEVALLKEETSSMITVHSEIDGSFLADYLADGLVIATPTGSTAYNLAAGGPVLQPTIDCIVVSPIAAHTLTMRPLVVAGESHLKLTISSRQDNFRLSLDGRSFRMRSGESVEIEKAPFFTYILRRPEDDFPTILRDKLLWGRR